MNKLKEKQKMFCKEYLIDLNATQAAIRAGYSKNTARTIASELLTKPDIQVCIQNLMSERSKKVNISAENILNDILDTRDRCKEYMVIEGRSGKHIDKAAVNGRNKSNELLGRHLKLFTDKLEIVDASTVVVGDIDD